MIEYNEFSKCYRQRAQKLRETEGEKGGGSEERILKSRSKDGMGLLINVRS